MRRSSSEEHVLRDRGYKLIQKLGEGGYAKVYLAEFHSKKKAMHSKRIIKLACKVINIENVQKKFITKFLPRELAILSKINHPHIIPIHSIFYRKQNYYIFMRCAEKGDLLELLLSRGAIVEAQARFWVKQLSLAIQYLHILEIAHRDIKCENILITLHNNVLLSDFGFARSTLDDENMAVQSETYCGSLSYAPPEILKGSKPYSPKVADMWSFGILIYTMLNKGNPFDTKNIKQFYDCQMKRKWKFRTKYSNVSKEIIDLVGHLLEPDIESRYKIADVIDSDWIKMDRKLKTLTQDEYKALDNAMVIARSRGVQVNSITDVERRRSVDVFRRFSIHRSSLTVFKEYTSAFNLQLLSTELSFAGQLSK